MQNARAAQPSVQRPVIDTQKRDYRGKAKQRQLLHHANTRRCEQQRKMVSCVPCGSGMREAGPLTPSRRVEPKLLQRVEDKAELQRRATSIRARLPQVRRNSYAIAQNWNR